MTDPLPVLDTPDVGHTGYIGHNGENSIELKSQNFSRITAVPVAGDGSMTKEGSIFSDERAQHSDEEILIGSNSLSKEVRFGG